MKFLPVLKWMINISLFVALAAGGTAVYFWKNSDDLIQDQVQQRFAQMAPELRLVVGSTALHGTQGATLSDVEIQERATGNPLFRAKSLKVDIDSNRLMEHQQVVVDRIHLRSADVLLTRLEDGRWNWQNYTYKAPEKTTNTLPQVVLEDIRIQLTLKHGHGIPDARLLLTSPNIQAVPTSQHGYDFDGAISLPGAGLLKVGGMCDLNSKEWKVGGNLRGVQADQQLMNLAKATSPHLQEQLTILDSAIENAIPRTASAGDRPTGAALLIGNDSSIAPQFLGLLDVHFNVSGDASSAIPKFQLMVGVREGRIASPGIPIQLSNVKAAFFKDNQNLEVRVDTAVWDGAQLSGNVLISTAEGAAPPTANFHIERLPITEEIRSLLNPKQLRLFDAFQPVGRLTTQGQLIQNASGRWKPHNVTAELYGGSMLHHKFRYPVTDLAVTLKQRPYQVQNSSGTDPALTSEDVMMDVNATATLGAKPVQATGWLRNPGPVAETRFQVSINDLDLDSRFKNALEEKHQRVVDSLTLAGVADAELVFYRPPGLDKITQPYFDVRVSNGTMRFKKFPYDIGDLTAHLTYDGPTKHWRFHDIRGSHGNGQLQAVGNFRGQPAPGDLDLSITARGAALDSDLYNALSRSHRKLWKMIDPDGFCDLTAKIHWTAISGHPAVVSFPQDAPVRVYNTTIRPEAFPLEMQVNEAILSYDPNDPRNAGVQHCEIHSYQAMHGNAPIKARGWTEAKPNGEWQVHLNNVSARNLKPDDNLRSALPATWHETLSRVHRAGAVSIENSELDFRGDMAGRMNTTAGWDLNMRFSDCTIEAGLDVSHIYGLMTAHGHWDGFHLKNTGNIKVETAEVLEMPFTHINGPYSLNDVELVLGARPVFERSTLLAKVDRKSRMKAQAYGGELTFDALVDMREDGRYFFFTELEKARLESYAALHIPDQSNLKGVVNAWMSLEGYGDDTKNVVGKGQLRISPAALYELPVMVQLLGSLSQLTPNVSNRTAFNYAIMDFSVREKAFWIDPVDLVGEAISFRGRGSVGFGGAVDLDLYSRPARTRTVPLPIISGLFTNWAKIEVRGTTSNPQTRAAPLGQLDQGMKQFLQSFNPAPGGPVPTIVAPLAFGQRSDTFRQRRQRRMEARQQAAQPERQ